MIIIGRLMPFFYWKKKGISLPIMIIIIYCMLHHKALFVSTLNHWDQGELEGTGEDFDL
jgi:hypothetical protein